MESAPTQEEAEKFEIQKEAEMKEWWEELDHQDRYKIFKYHKDLFTYRDCAHQWRPITSYDQQIAMCHKCEMTNRHPKKEDFDWIDCDHDWKPMHNDQHEVCFKCKSARPFGMTEFID